MSWPQVFPIFKKAVYESLKGIIVSSNYHQLIKVKGQYVVSDRALEARALVEAIKVELSKWDILYIYIYI